MLEKFIPGWILNSFCLLHLLFIDKSRLSLKLLALPILAIPYLGIVFYLIIYAWEIPSPISEDSERQFQEQMAFRTIPDPRQQVEENEDSDLYLIGEEYDHSDLDWTGEGYDYSEEHIQFDDKPTRTGRSSLWLRVTMFVLGVAFWGIGIQSLKKGLFNPLFLFGGAFCMYMAFVKWNKS